MERARTPPTYLQRWLRGSSAILRASSMVSATKVVRSRAQSSPRAMGLPLTLSRSLLVGGEGFPEALAGAEPGHGFHPVLGGDDEAGCFVYDVPERGVGILEGLGLDGHADVFTGLGAVAGVSGVPGVAVLDAGMGNLWNSPSQVKGSSVQAFFIISTVSRNTRQFLSPSRRSASMLRLVSSRGKMPRPTPHSTRPPLSWSSMATSSAMRRGCH